MDLNIYQIILRPVVSDKAYKLNQNLKKLVVRVHPQANKPMIANALEKLFNVKVKTIRTVTRKGKNKMVRRRIVKGPIEKKAIVTLQEGYSLDFINQAGAPVTQEHPKA
jgi:large subunit ribosomal protein L23